MIGRYLPIFVLLRAVTGVFIGLYSPFIATTFAPMGEIYIRLMEVIVLPYLLASLIQGLGRLSQETATKLFRKSWMIYLSLWATAFLVLVAMALTVPRVQKPAVVNFAQAGIGEGASGETLIDLLIPNNLFEALNNNYIPSVVLIGIIFGVAIQKIEKRDAFLDVLSVVRMACIRIWGWIIFLAPLGICALMAKSVSGMNSDGFEAMAIYVVVICLSGLLLGVWILPMLLSCFLPLSYREILSALKEAILIAIVTSLSVAALPLVQRAAQDLAHKVCGQEDQEQQKEIIQTALSVSYPLAQVGNFFILVFILYASFYFFVPIATVQLIELPFVTLLSGIGSPTSSIGAVSFMSGWLNMPASTTNLYIETMTVTRYVQVLASVSGFAFVTFLVTFNFYGQLTFRPARLVVTLTVSVLALSAIWSVGRWGGSHLPLHSEASYRAMVLPGALQAFSDANAIANVEKNAANAEIDQSTATHASALERIQAAGTLRVGFNRNVMPFVYENDLGRFVGFDVEMMYRFAQDMNVELQLVPYVWNEVDGALGNGAFDIAIGGVYITNKRLKNLNISDPYYLSPLALIVNNDRLEEFASRKTIEEASDLTIAVFESPILVPLAKRSFPNAKLKILSDYEDLANMAGIDAAIWTLEQARAWAISEDRFSAVVPKDMSIQFMFGYALPREAHDVTDYLNFWLRKQRRNGTLEAMKKRWISPAADDMNR